MAFNHKARAGRDQNPLNQRAATIRDLTPGVIVTLCERSRVRPNVFNAATARYQVLGEPTTGYLPPVGDPSLDISALHTPGQHKELLVLCAVVGADAATPPVWCSLAAMGISPRSSAGSGVSVWDRDHFALVGPAPAVLSHQSQTTPANTAPSSPQLAVHA